VLLSEVVGAISTSVGEVEQLAGGPALTEAEALALVDRIVAAIAAFLAERAKARLAFGVMAASGDTTIH
jgi:hypothetical protein